MKIVFKKSKHKEWYWTATSKNNKQICKSSETYKTKRACLNSWLITQTAIKQGNFSLEG